MKNCKVCGKQTKRLSNKGVCYSNQFSSVNCSDYLCSCGRVMMVTAHDIVYGCFCDDEGKEIKALYCLVCKEGKIIKL